MVPGNKIRVKTQHLGWHSLVDEVYRPGSFGAAKLKMGRKAAYELSIDNSILIRAKLPDMVDG